MDIRQALYTIKKEFIALEAQADKCSELHTLAYSGGGALRYDRDRVQTSQSNNQMSIVHKLVDEEQKMLKMMMEHKEHRITVLKAIRHLPDDEYYLIHQYFFESKTYGQINPDEPYKVTKQKIHNIVRHCNKTIYIETIK